MSKKASGRRFSAGRLRTNAPPAPKRSAGIFSPRLGEIHAGSRSLSFGRGQKSAAGGLPGCIKPSFRLSGKDSPSFLLLFRRSHTGKFVIAATSYLTQPACPI